MIRRMIIKKRNMSIGRILYCILCWTLAFLAPGCGLFDHEADDVVIVIGSTRLTRDTLKREMEFIGGGIPAPAKHAGEAKNLLINQIIDYYLIMEYGKENGIFISESEFQTHLTDIKKEYTENAFQKALLQGYVDPALWELRLRNQLLVTKVIGQVSERIAPPSYEEIKRYFQENRNEFRSPEMLRFRQIVCNSKEEAENLSNRLHSGEDLEELARKYSVAPEAETGGEVGWVAMGDLDETMENALFSLQIGEISPVVKTDVGYHLFEVLARRPAGIKRLPEVIDEIESKLLRQKREDFYREWLKELRSDFNVKINQAILDKLELS